MSNKQRTILLNDVNDIEIANHQGKFTWVFHDYKKNMDVKIKLDRWWIKVLAENLWEVVEDEQRELDKLCGSLGNNN